jgi:tetratricopeptide (TPR) repeat protein
MSSTRLGFFGLAIVASIGVALACGPNFPWQLFDDRAETVSAPVGLSFAFEIKRLAPAPSDKLVAVEPEDTYSPNPEPEVVIAEREEAQSGAWALILPGGVTLSTERLLEKLEAARKAEDGKAALIAGEGLPVAVLDYIAGAIEFHAGRLDTATQYFEAIDRLPPALRRIRTVAAAYMLGRIQQLNGEFDAARKSFQAVRARAQAGAPDPMGLAVASLGEEARGDLVEVGLQDVPWNVLPSGIDYARARTLIGRAVRLYVEQAAYGSKVALLSLREVAGLLVADSDALDRAIADPLVRQLLVAYVVARDGQSIYADSVAGPKDQVVTAVINAVLTEPDPDAGDDLDRLAALAYQAARYDVAEKLTATTKRPLGLWIRAKLALRRNDRAAAVRDWTAALNATVGAGNAATLDDAAKTRLRGETTVMTVSDGRYGDSLRLLFPVARTYWGDVAYIAERVLTTDELKAFVDGLPEFDKPSQPDDGYAITSRPIASLRDLLARRLVRDGRRQEAQSYFSTTPTEYAPDSPSPSVEARAYAEAITAAQPSWPWQRVSRAEALFTAAMLARKQGMEIMGTEGPPDEAALGGNFESGVGQTSPVPDRQRSPEEGMPMPYDSKSLLGPDEERRFASSAPKPDVRFHYRLIASDHAVAAADLLPERSQAYAAALCWAARYAKDGNDLPRTEKIYRRYVATGAYQPWAKSFGGTCPAPDFEAARTFWPRRIEAWSEQMIGSAKRHAVILGLGAVAGLLLLMVAVRMIRARRASPAP